MEEIIIGEMPIDEKLIKKLEQAADEILEEERELEEEDKDYTGSIISLEKLSYIMYRMRTVRLFLDERYGYDEPCVEQIGIDYDTDKDLFYTMPRSVMLREVLGFYKEIDNDLYIEVLKMLTMQIPNKDIKIYDIYAENKLGQEYEEFFPKENSMNENVNGKRTIYIALMENETEEIAREIQNYLHNTELCTFMDMTKLAHEIAHGLDIDDSKSITQSTLLEKNKVKYITSTTRKYLTETTAIFFECLFLDYLSRNKDKSLSPLLNYLQKSRIEGADREIIETETKADIAIERSQKGKITPQLVQKILERSILQENLFEMLSEEHSLYETRQYALAAFLVPSMLATYKKDKKEGNRRIMKYLECAKQNNFDGALQAFGIDINSDKGIEEVIRNYGRYIEEYEYGIREGQER